MFKPHPIVAFAVLACLIVAATAYVSFIHAVPFINLWVGWVAAVIFAMVLVVGSRRHEFFAIYAIGFSAAFGLASLQFSIDQPTFTPEFLAFAGIHLSLLGLAIWLGGGYAGPAVGTQNRPGVFLTNALLYVFISIAAFVVMTKGTRLDGFIGGVKESGDVFRIAGISGIQGILAIFLMCAFSALKPFNKIVYILAVCVLAILDVKRGDMLRLGIFLFFYSALVMPTWRATWVKQAILPLILVGSVVVLVVGGEVRQQLYDPEFSVSYLLNARIDSEPLSWIYGYSGINPSVLQVAFEREIAGTGYIPQLLELVVSSEIQDPGVVASINGFNAGTVLAAFAGNGVIAPSIDFLVFCGLVFLMVLGARKVGTPSIRAFMFLIIVGFTFGNYLMQPAYLAGFLLAVVVPLIPSVRWRSSPSAAGWPALRA